MRIFRTVANIGVWRIFFPLLLVIAIMFASNYIVFKNSVDEIYEQVSKNNDLVMESAIQRFDDAFRKLNNLIYSIQSLPYETLDAFDGRKTDMISAYMFRKQISMLVSSASLEYLEEVVVFFRGHDLAITSTGTIDLDQLFKQQYKHGQYTTDYWKSYADTQHALKVFPEASYMNMTTPYRHDERKLLVILGNNNLSNKNLMLFVNAASLMQHVMQTMAEQSSLIIMDQDRKVLMSTEREWNLAQILDAFQWNEGELATRSMRGDQYSQYQSSYNGYFYISKLPIRFDQIESAARYNQVVMLTAIVCALILSLGLSVYLFKPVRKLYRLFGGDPNKQADYRFIQNRIVKIQQENASYRSSIEDIEAARHKQIWLDALDCYEASDVMEKNMQRYRYAFWESAYFMMVCVRLTWRYSSELSGEMISVEEIGALMGEGLDRQLDDVTVLHHRNLEFLILLPVHRRTEKPKLVHTLEVFLQRLKADKLQHYAVIASTGKPYAPSLSNYRLAYQNAIDAIAYRNMGNSSSLIDLEQIQFTGKVHFPLDEVERLSHSLLSGNKEDAIRVIDEIIGENVCLQVNYHQFVHVVKSLFYQMLPLMPQSSKQTELHQLEQDFCRDVEQVLPPEEVREVLVQMAESIAEEGMKSTKGKLNASFIAQYIEMHYMENLYQDHMAKVFDTTPKYFSNYFKKTFQVNYVDYLNRVRIKNAKEMLKHSTLSVAEIGEKVGYLNNTTFVSTFKKYSGISPGEYRKNA